MLICCIRFLYDWSFRLYYYHYHLLLSKFFTPVFADGFSLEFNWHQDSAQYSDWSYKCFSFGYSTRPLISNSSSLCTNPWWLDFIIIIIIYSSRVFHISILMVFHWSLSDSKSPQVSRTRLSILMVRKKSRQVIWRWKYTMNHSQGEKYILEKKKRPTLSYQLKKIKKKKHR